MTKHRVGVLIFDDVEILDFAGPAEVFASAKKDGQPCFEVITFGVDFSTILTFGGIEINANLSINNFIPLDVVIVPGGYGVNEVLKNEKLSEWLNYQKQQGAIIASVCTGAFILAEFGFLKGLSATTHHMDIEDLKVKYPEIMVVENQRFVVEDHIITSAGVSSGIDMSLYIVNQLCGIDVANACKKRMEWGDFDKRKS